MSTRALRGVTLIELLMAIVVLAIGVAGITRLSAELTRTSADPLVQRQAIAIAESYAEEVALRPFCDPNMDVDGNPATPLVCRTDCTASACSGCRVSGAATEGSRALFDDVCDYNGLNDNGAVDQSGAAIAGLEGYSVSVAVVDTATLGSAPALQGSAGQVVRIDVTVTHAGIDPVRLSRFRTNH